jgi:hypothetical protein
VTWRYQATHRTVKTSTGADEDVYEVREVYEGLNKNGTDAWTEDAIAAISETKDGLVEVLQMMLKDVQEYDVLEVAT